MCIYCDNCKYSIDLLELGVDVFSVYVHSAICETYVGIPHIYCQLMVFSYCAICKTIVNSMDLLSIGVGGRCILSICAFYYMCNLFGVMYSIHLLSDVIYCHLFGYSIHLWSIGGWGTCILVYVFSVYVHSDICQSYVV